MAATLRDRLKWWKPLYTPEDVTARQGMTLNSTVNKTLLQATQFQVGAVLHSSGCKPGVINRVAQIFDNLRALDAKEDTRLIGRMAEAHKEGE